MTSHLVIIGSALLVSLISVLGIIVMVIKRKMLKKILFILVSFAAGSLLGATFFDILPEVVNEYGSGNISFVLVGIVIFFALEKYVHWHHCHEGDCDVKPLAYLNLIGDGAHNLIDGALIAASYLHSFNLGMITTLAVIFHEIPQELGDFGILVHAGLKPKKALIFNLLSALVAVLGSLITIYFDGISENLIPVILSITAGGFIYLALVDIMPEIHKEHEGKNTLVQSLVFFLGLLIMYLLTKIWAH